MVLRSIVVGIISGVIAYYITGKRELFATDPVLVQLAWTAPDKLEALRTTFDYAVDQGKSGAEIDAMVTQAGAEIARQYLTSSDTALVDYMKWSFDNMRINMTAPPPFRHILLRRIQSAELRSVCT